MKKKILFIALCISSFLNAQSISFTSAALTNAEIGSTITVDFTYSISADGYIYSAIELQDDFTYQSTIVDAELNPAVAGTDVTGSFTFTIPESTTPTSDLTGNLNYKIKIELKDASFNYLAGQFPDTEINITSSNLSVDDFNKTLSDIEAYPNPAKNKIYFQNLKNDVDYKAFIFNILGKNILSVNQLENGIDISSLNDGIYLLSIKSNNKVKNLKFIKN
ncbi:T9SS type A sorting domain-containing protein [Polaribacter atrinae]|uniref:T9SS type A sorting domain-containing protein n=1 Tax=Polaribacter atrinae TaxID=1333662 RepID=UPI002492F970|nr:T9SS type A sorting domain-containing protein [Polaribacter atrinae]